MLESDILNASKYPYKPDIIMGYKGQKVGVFVVTETSATLDTQKPDGTQLFRQRILAKANQGLQVSALPVTAVVDYDIEGLKVDIKQGFNFGQFLDSTIP